MCTNGTQVPCEVPSLPSPTTRKGWPHHRGIRPLLFSNNDVGSFTSHKNKSVKVLCDGTYGLSSLSEKTRKSNHLQMSFQRQHPERWSGRSLNPGPPARQTGALPFELTRRRLNLATHTLRSSILLFWYTALGQCVRHKWKKTATQFLQACWQARLGVSETESPGDLVVKRRKQAVTCLSICSITLSGNITPKTERNMFL